MTDDTITDGNEQGQTERTRDVETSRRDFIKIAGASAAGASLTAGTAAAADGTVTIDDSVKHQEIEGFGGFGAKRQWWEAEPLWTDAFVDRIVNDLGLTILRDNLPVNFELDNDNSDPYTTDLSGYNLTENPSDSCQGGDSVLDDHLPYLDAVQSQAASSGEPFKLVPAIWSPPYWMKLDDCQWGSGGETWNRLSEGRHAKPDYYPEYAEYLHAYIETLQNQIGLTPYALSPQNEPAFNQDYASCVYNPRQYRRLIDHVGQRLQNEGHDVKLYGPEDIQDFSRINNYVTKTMEDPTTRAYQDIMAVHGYGSAGTDPNGTGATQWARTFDLAHQYNKPLWMTETSGYSNDWAGALDLATSIHVALKHGKISAWVFWSLSTQGGGEYSIMTDGEPTKRYYTSKNYYRWIRPGAVQIESSSDNSDVAVTAFEHEANGTLTLVLVNTATSSRTVSLSGSNLPSSFEAYRSSSSENTASVGPVYSSDTFTLPAESVTTLYSTNYSANPVTGSPTITSQPADATVSAGEAAEFSVELAEPYPYDADFQWYRNGTAIQGATTPELRLENLDAGADGDTVHVEVTNAPGTTTSATATISVSGFGGASIAQAPSPPTIDGTVDSVWSEAPAHEVTNQIAGSIDSSSDLSGTWRAMWDDSNLYVLAEVTDDQIVTDSDNPWSDDAVELYVDADGRSPTTTYDSDEFQYGIKADGTVVEAKHGGEHDLVDGTTDVTAATTTRSDGWNLEVQIPWSTLNATPASGNFVGVEVHLVDDDTGGGRDGKLAWHATEDTIWQNPQQMGVGRLEGDGSSGETPTGQGEIVREYWTSVTGTSVADIPTGTSPDGTQTITDVFEGPVDWADDYGARLEGYITAPESGDYQFWIASDDNSELHLSTDDTAANASVIASVDGWTGYQEWNKYASQQSGAVSLTEGQQYYVKVLHKEATGGDNVSVGWRTPSDGSGSSPAEVVPASQLSPYGDTQEFTSSTDVGPVDAAGSTSYSSGTYTIDGAGADIWGSADEFHYAYEQVSGDVTVTARVASQENTDPWAKAGVMIRESLNADSKHASTFVTPESGVAFQRRTSTGGSSGHTSGSSSAAPHWVRIERSGDTFTASESSDGSSWTQVDSVTIAMTTDVYVGLPVTSHSAGTLCTGEFDEVVLR